MGNITMKDTTKVGATRYNYLMVYLMALVSYGSGFQTGILGSVLGFTSFFEYFNIETTGPNASHGNSLLGALNGVYFAGAAITCLSMHFIIDAIGRKRGLQLCCVVYIIGGALQGGAVAFGMLIVGRLISGFAFGMVMIAIPTYQSEMSPAAVRGRMVGSHGAFLIMGFCIANWVGYGCFFATGNSQWRISLSLQVVGPIIALALSPILPESPRWLVFKDRPQAGLQVLEKLHSRKEDNDHILAKEEFYQIQEQVALERELSNSFLSIFKRASYRKRVLCGCLVQFSAISTGILVLVNYQVSLYEQLGLKGSTPVLLLAVYNTWAAIVNYGGTLIVDYVGRVRQMLIGFCGAIVCISCLTAMLAQFSGTGNRVGNGFGVFFLFLYEFFYGGFIDAISFIYVTEIFPSAIRAQGVGLSLCAYMLGTLVYTQVAPTANITIGWRYFLVFITVPAAGAACIWYFAPETKGLSLEEVAAQFGDEVAVDLTHMTAEKRQQIDRKLLGIESAVEGDSGKVSANQIEVQV